MQGIAAPFVLTFRLWGRFWPQLMALVLAGVLAHDVLLLLAVRTGFANHLAGLAVLTLVALAQLVVTVTMRSEEHTSELQSLMRISYAVFCLKKKTHTHMK